MEIEKLKELISGDYADLQKAFLAETIKPQVEVYTKQYDPVLHEINDKAKRPDKIVETDAGISAVAVARLSVPMQKKITQLAVTFLCGRPIALYATPKDQAQIDLLSVIQKTWDDNKLDYDTQELARILFSETEVAEVWYVEEVEPEHWEGTANQGKTLKLRMKILANSLGDTLQPVFTSSGDMIAFGRQYQLTEAGKKVDCYDVYTAENVIIGKKVEGTWIAESKPNAVGKIPVVYYKRPGTEWGDVQTLIDRFEKLLSNHSDTNDYFGSPMVLVQGEVKGFAKKGEQGKVLELTEGADAKYMSWDSSPESVKTEYNNLRSLIHDMTDSPDISFENMKSLGTFSGIALKMLFLGAHMKASSNEQVFGKGIQRRINFLKAAMGKINISMEKTGNALGIKPKFEYFVPEDVEGKVTTLLAANGNKPIISQKTAVKMNPLVSDADAEQLLIDEEKSQELPAALEGEI